MGKLTSKNQLQQSLTLFPTTMIVIGSVVGSGIFVSSAGMARSLGSAPWMLAVWVFAGILTLFGAFTQCELASQMPRTGGLYEYLKIIYGETMGFIYGWANFMIAGSGAIAAIAYIFASYFGEFVNLPHLSPELEKWPLHLPLIGTLFPLADIGKKIVGSLLIAFLTLLNVRGVKIGATLQSISTSAKILAILVIVGIAFIFGSGVGSMDHLHSVSEAGSSLSGWTLIGAISVAMSGAFWSYDGWGNVAYIGGEVREPSRTLPRAIVLGTFSFIALYLLINLAYLYILPIDVLGKVADDRVASAMVSAIFRTPGAMMVAALILLSTFDTTNSSILTNSRVYYAMANDGVFWKKASETHPQYQTPHVSLWCQGVWAIILLCSGSFDSIMSMYVFVNWALYVLMAIGLFVLRKRNPSAIRPFSVPGYPWVPAIFLLFSFVYVVVTLVSDVSAYQSGAQPLIKSLAGIALVLTGLPFYFLWRRI